MSVLIHDLKRKLARQVALLAAATKSDKQERRALRDRTERRLCSLLRAQGPSYMAYGDRYIYKGQEGSDIILRTLRTNQPCLIARFGGTEMKAIHEFITCKDYQKDYSRHITREIANNSGFFPANPETLSRFGAESITVASQVDVLCCWRREPEKTLAERYSSGAVLVDLGCTDPTLFPSPWTQALEGKKVLVVHPFTDSIQKQYGKRALLFSNPLILPDFELKLLKAVQSRGEARRDVPYTSWFEALACMQHQIDEVDFDIALIGAAHTVCFWVPTAKASVSRRSTWEALPSSFLEFTGIDIRIEAM